MKRTTHEIWHNFTGYLKRKYGKDLHGPPSYIKLGSKSVKIDNFDKNQLFQRLTGYEVIFTIKRWCKRYAPEIKIISVDDSVYAGSILLLIPHPQHGITILFIPQCTTIQNHFFLYKNHYKCLLKELDSLANVYKK